jgi:serine/threonine protein phosphatase PrpC
MEGEALSEIGTESVNLLRIGDPSNFGKNDWWSLSDWHKITASGFSCDVVCDAGTAGELAIAGVSIRGHKHRVDGSPNEDSFAVRIANGGDGCEYAVLVVCDGLSSAKHSAYAARRTSTLVADMLSRVIANADFTIERFKLVISTCLKEFVVPELISWPNPSGELSLPAFGCPDIRSSEVSTSELLVTLTIAIVPTKNGPKGASDILLATIGDSPALILTQKGEWVRPEYSVGDDGVLTTTTAAFPKNSDIAVSEVVLYEGDCLCLMSDGVGNFVKNRNEPLRLGKHLAQVWKTPRDIPTLIRDVSFDLRSADDDRTVILCWTDREIPDSSSTLQSLNSTQDASQTAEAVSE